MDLLKALFVMLGLAVPYNIELIDPQKIANFIRTPTSSLLSMRTSQPSSQKPSLTTITVIALGSAGALFFGDLFKKIYYHLWYAENSNKIVKKNNETLHKIQTNQNINTKKTHENGDKLTAIKKFLDNEKQKNNDTLQAIKALISNGTKELKQGQNDIKISIESQGSTLKNHVQNQHKETQNFINNRFVEFKSFLENKK